MTFCLNSKSQSRILPGTLVLALKNYRLRHTISTGCAEQVIGGIRITVNASFQTTIHGCYTWSTKRIAKRNPHHYHNNTNVLNMTTSTFFLSLPSYTLCVIIIQWVTPNCTPPPSHTHCSFERYTIGIKMRRVLSATVVAAAVAAAPIVSCSSSTGAALHTPGVANWTLCRASDVNAAGLSGHNVSVFGWTPSAALRSACIFTDRPSTALAALTTNGTFPDPFVDDNMASAIPDISVSTPSFYTYYFVVNANSNCSADAASTRLLLRLGQINYRASVFIDGAAIAPVGVGTPDAVGMFQRFLFSGDASVGAGPQGHGLAVLVMPADHPGNASNACKGCGQGGNHELALDVTSQYGGGWDWIGGTPDRQTGLFDTFTLSAVPSGVLMRDPIAVVTALGNVSDDGVAAVGLNATITVSVLRVPSTGPASQNVTGTLTLNITELGVMTVAISLPPTVNGTDARWVDVSFPSLVPESVDLWWPHNAGSPRLYDAVLTFLPDNAAWAPTVLNWRVGFRTVDSDIDSGLGGREFHVNGRRVFLQGGNFIASDQVCVVS